MWRKLYHAVLGVIAGVFLSVWVIPLASTVFWRRFDPKDWGRGVIAILCLVLGGVAGLVFGLRWGGYRLGGQAKRRGLGAIDPLGGTGIDPNESDTSGAKQDEDSISNLE